MKVFVEAGAKRVFAGAIDWPGLSRSGPDEAAAVDALLDYVPRYVKAIGGPARELEVPVDTAAVKIAARLEGGSGTDFGVPSRIADFDRRPLGEDELAYQLNILRTSWRALSTAADRATGVQLATGPRGGGRDLEKIVEHVRDADGAYISQLGAKPPRGAGWAALQEAFVDALGAKLRGELPERGPRGGERWPARYAIRRSAWHALDHAWEIEDRSA